MSNLLTKGLGVAVVALAVGGLAYKATALQGSAKKGAKAPEFSAQGTDGKTHTLKSLTKDGPVFLYFIKIGCPVNHRAAPHITNIEKAYGEKGNVIGVINGSVEDGKNWAARYGAKYPILSDPDLKIIRGYGAPYSPFLIEVGKDGKMSSVFEGLSPKELGSVNTNIAKSLDVKAAELAYTGAPSGGG